MTVQVRLDHAGIAAILKSGPVAALVNSAAEEVAANVKGLGIMVSGIPGTEVLPVVVASGVSDRARATVTINHPAGLAVQAKHGALTKAAAAAGLEVKS